MIRLNFSNWRYIQSEEKWSQDADLERRSVNADLESMKENYNRVKRAAEF